MAMSCGIRSLLVAAGAASVWLLQPSGAVAQCDALDPPCENAAPVVTFTPPSYVSLDTERAVTLVYRSGKGAQRQVLVEVDATSRRTCRRRCRSGCGGRTGRG